MSQITNYINFTKMQELSAIYIVSNTTHATVSLPELNAQARLCKQASRLSLTAKCQRE